MQNRRGCDVPLEYENLIVFSSISPLKWIRYKQIQIIIAGVYTGKYVVCK